MAHVPCALARLVLGLYLQPNRYCQSLPAGHRYVLVPPSDNLEPRVVTLDMREAPNTAQQRLRKYQSTCQSSPEQLQSAWPAFTSFDCNSMYLHLDIIV
jgi:hypothetical protein